MAKTATVKEPEQGEMFPDLDKKKPADKKLITTALAWIAIFDERKKYLEDALERENEAHDRMVEAAHVVGLKKFNVAGRDVVIETKEKAKVKASKVDPDAQDRADEANEE